MSDRDLDEEAFVSKPAKSSLSLKARAVRLLSVREHTRQELARKLSPYADDAEALQALLDELAKQGWQSDARFSRSFEDSKLGRHGSRRIASAMRERGVSDTLIQESLERLKDSEAERAWQVWQRKFGPTGLPLEAKEYARQARFMASRGFDLQLIGKILGGRFDPEANQ